MTKEETYKQALRTIVCILEPLGYKCTCNQCDGCDFEMQEALHVAMNVLAGLAEDAHWVPHPVTRQKNGKLTPHDQATCVSCHQYHPNESERDAAFAAIGFVKDGKMWKRGNAF